MVSSAFEVPIGIRKAKQDFLKPTGGVGDDVAQPHQHLTSN